MQIVLLSTDLMLASAAHGAADRHDADLVVAPDSASALKTCAERATELLAIDLRTPGLDIHALMTELRGTASTPIWVMACAPHVHEASLAGAAAAGCDEIVSRGEFERRLDVTLARLASTAG